MVEVKKPSEINYQDGQWHRWTGGECPVDPDDIVKVIYRGGMMSEDYPATMWGWHHTGTHVDVISFRVARAKKTR